MPKTFWSFDDSLRAEKPGMGLAGQPLANLEPTVVPRLARYRGLDGRILPQSTDLPDAMPLSPAAPVHGSASGKLGRDQAPTRRHASRWRRLRVPVLVLGSVLLAATMSVSADGLDDAYVLVGKQQTKYSVVKGSKDAKSFVGLSEDGRRREYRELVGGTVADIATREIFGNLEAADLVACAREYDSQYCQLARADRGKAILLYEQAIAAQPGAKINAPIANRIAQLYAFTEDKSKNTRVNPASATEWWRRCAAGTSPKQLLWIEANIGLGSASVMSGDMSSARAAYKMVLQADPASIELPDWQLWPSDTDRHKAAREKELQRLRGSAEELRKRAVTKLFYAANRQDLQTSISEMSRIMRDYKGTTLAQHASELLKDKAAQLEGPDRFSLPKDLLNHSGGAPPDPSKQRPPERGGQPVPLAGHLPANPPQPGHTWWATAMWFTLLITGILTSVLLLRMLARSHASRQE